MERKGGGRDGARPSRVSRHAGGRGVVNGRDGARPSRLDDSLVVPFALHDASRQIAGGFLPARARQN